VVYASAYAYMLLSHSVYRMKVHIYSRFVSVVETKYGVRCSFESSRLLNKDAILLIIATLRVL
jgi:hypothetical protein